MSGMAGHASPIANRKAQEMQLIKLGKSTWINPDGITHIEDDHGTIVIYFNSHGYMEIPISHMDYDAVRDFIAGLEVENASNSDAQRGEYVYSTIKRMRNCGYVHAGICKKELTKDW
jgi:hypothetical protein